ncbi:MAG TPA: hypothetical protein VFT99_26340, partial [Roseiflexaceae bacterium]|nr:hypothetical protein [Roseiflexaceae bacterium]
CEGSKPNTSAARYHVTSSAGNNEVVVDQAKHAGSWVSLGSFAFSAGQGGFVELHDVTGHGLDVMWFDAVKWVPAN